jgi:hypothetical protein
VAPRSRARRQKCNAERKRDVSSQTACDNPDGDRASPRHASGSGKYSDRLERPNPGSCPISRGSDSIVCLASIHRRPPTRGVPT